jgi:hypothetical protein
MHPRICRDSPSRKDVLELAANGASAVRHDFQLEVQQTLVVRVLTPDGRPFRDADLGPSGKPK